MVTADSTTPVGSTRRPTSGVDAPLDACPRCSGESLHAETTFDRPVFRCAHCGVGWIYELGYARAVTAGSTRLWRVANAPRATSM
jgi:hypothetical protein